MAKIPKMPVKFRTSKFSALIHSKKWLKEEMEEVKGKKETVYDGKITQQIK